MTDDNAELHHELRQYLIGFALSLALTVVAFGLVAWGGLAFKTALATIGALAIIQIIVQFRYFLHIDLSAQKREDLHLVLFTILLLTIMAAGTIWIMSNLAVRMM
ncbi:cytochrome bo(3) ubiquinol oxidase subunit 4 [Rhodobiaceae bacterium]|nr:cytochrome bo(3) ubiquinol oxidase subunit 4 [Rhodobiaceae bacterium]